MMANDFLNGGKCRHDNSQGGLGRFCLNCPDRGRGEAKRPAHHKLEAILHAVTREAADDAAERLAREPQPETLSPREAFGFRPFTPLGQLPTRRRGWSDDAREHGAVLKILWPREYPREADALSPGEVPLLLVRNLGSGLTVQTRFAAPEEQAEMLAATRLEVRRRAVLHIFAMHPHEREEFFFEAGWRRIGGRLVKVAAEPA